MSMKLAAEQLVLTRKKLFLCIKTGRDYPYVSITSTVNETPKENSDPAQPLLDESGNFHAWSALSYSINFNTNSAVMDREAAQP